MTVPQPVDATHRFGQDSQHWSTPEEALPVGLAIRLYLGGDGKLRADATQRHRWITKQIVFGLA